MPKADQSRGFAPVEMTIQIYSTALETMKAHSTAADTCRDSVPPQVRAMLDLHEQTARHASCNVKFTSADQSQAKVTAHSNISRAYHIVDTTKHECTCGLRALTGFPCEDEVAAALAMSVSPGKRRCKAEDLLEGQDRRFFWREQLAYDYNSAEIATALVYDGPGDDTVRMPLAAPRPAGRPKQSREKSFLEKQGLAPASSAGGLASG